MKLYTQDPHKAGAASWPQDAGLLQDCCRIRLGAHTTDHGIIRDQQPLPKNTQEWRREFGSLKADSSVKIWSEALFA